MSRRLIRLHRGLGLAMLVFWLLQSLAGVLLVFRWEIEDAMLAGTAARADPAALGDRIAALTAAGARPVDVWATADVATRFDIYYVDRAGGERIMRVDGAGRILRDAADAGRFANGALFDTLTEFHTELLLGEAGSWIVAASGLLLLAHVTIGLRIAWPRRGQWGAALFRRSTGGAAARLYGWHRRLGLWLGVPLLPFAGAGVLLCFEHGLRERIGQEIVAPAAKPAPVRVGPAAALALAAAKHPGARLSTLVLPADGSPWYRVRQLRVDDLRRNWGTSTLFVSASEPRVLADHPAARAPAGRQLVDGLYPFHTGQLAGPAGRTFVLMQGVLLAATIGVGLALWRTRRAR